MHDDARLRGLRAVDLNLLVALDALLQERSVTRAAEALGVTQPAASAALARLRRHFDDALLHRRGGRYELTSFAEVLRTPTAEALDGVARVFDSSTAFAASVTEREFTLLLSDYAAAVLGPAVSRLLHERAPAATLKLLNLPPFIRSNMMEVLRPVDGVVLPADMLADIPSVGLHEEHWTCVVAQDNETIGTHLTLEEAERAPWVLTWHGREGFTPAMQRLRSAGIEPRVELTLESFAAVPFCVADSQRVGVLPLRLAQQLEVAAGVRLVRPAWETTPTRMAMWWHPSRRADPAHAWLRRTVAEASHRLTQPSPRGDQRLRLPTKNATT
jgi:DNA-binding transcriptional LysR family regulator